MSVGLREIFLASQDSQSPHQLVKAFKKLYCDVEFEAFWTEFRYLILHPLRVFEREQAVENMIEFVSKAVTELALAQKKDLEANQKKDADADVCSDNIEEEDMHPFLLKFFEFLLDVHSAKDRGVRFRVCQIITRMLENLGEGAKIDDSLYDRIYHCMIDRLKDKCAIVRVHSVLALKRLQDPSDENCPITKAYVILMKRDPNIEVRRIILTTIAPSTHSLPAIIERTRDVKDTVRRTAFIVISEKIPVRALEIEQRIKLLQDGLNDRSEMVRTACANKLLQAWLISSQGNILDLLTRLDVQTSTKTCEEALKILFKQSSVFEIVEQFTIINEKALIPENQLTCECAFYWRNVVQHVQNAGPEYDEQLDQVKPNCLHFCEYLQRVSQQLVDCNDLDKMLDVEFIIQQLLQVLLCMDLSDQASRRRVSDLLSHLLLSDHVGSSLVDHILPCLAQLHNESGELVKVLAEIVSEIREPITSVEKEMPKSDRRDLDKKIAGIRVKLNQLREELGECIEKQDFERAAQLKADISHLDAERSSLLEDTEPRMEEVRTQRDDPLTMLKCLTIVCELLMSPKVECLTPTLHTLIDTQALPGMTNEEAEVRNAAVKAIGLSCLIKREIIMHHLPLLLQASQMDTQLVRTTAMKCIFDIIHVYGLDAFNDETDVTEQEPSQSQVASQVEDSRVENATEIINSSVATVNETTGMNTKGGVTTDRTGWSETANKIVTILSSSLDNESSDIRTVAAEGLSKLLLAGRVCSSKLLSRLLLLWYNPIVEDDETLLQTLGVFFPLFAFANSANQEQLEQAFVPTLKTLLRAPSSSPLADVNEANMASFMVELIDARLLIVNQQTQTTVMENPCHDSLARKLCNEILSKPDSFNVKLWLKTLNLLYLSVDNITMLKDLVSMCEDMAIVITEKQCVKMLEKFTDSVNNLYTDLKNRQTPHQSETESEAASETSQSREEELTTNMSSLSINPEAGDCNTPAPAARQTRRTKAKTAKTPMLTKESHGSILKSATKSCKKKDVSTLDDIFATPAPVKVNLQNIFSDCTTPESDKTLPDKATKTPKRPLHTIQDPKFTS